MSEASPAILSPPGEPDALLFIDLDGTAEEIEQLLRAVREVPAGFLTQATQVLGRLPFDGPSGPSRAEFRESVALSLQDNLRRRGVSPAAVGVVDFPIAAEPVVLWKPLTLNPTPVNSVVLARARRAELATLLGNARAIWEPTAYHYQLPSGLHSGRYVRTADAVQSPRDAVVLASWLHRHVSDRIGVVLDSASTVAIAVALASSATLAGFRLGPVVSLDDYPNSQFEVLAAVARAAASGSALALLSVSSSGRTRDRLIAALPERGHGVVEVLVDRQGRAAERLDDVGRGWIGLMEPGSDVGACPLCLDHRRSLVVDIDPKSFAPHSVPEPTLILPEIGDARDNRELMQLYDQSDAIGLECEPHPATQKLRPAGNLAFRFYPHRLVDPAGGVGDEFEKSLRRRFKTNQIANQFQDQPKKLEALLVLGLDHLSPGFDRLISIVEECLPFASGHRRLVVDDDLTPEVLAEELRGLREVLVLTVGSMSGVTLSDVNVQIHDHSEARAWGLAIHARPGSAREWATLCNAYNRNLAGAWVTLMPERSLFIEEAKALRFASSLTKPRGAQAVFVDRRMKRASSSPADWVSRTRDYEMAFGIDGAPKIAPNDAMFDPYAVYWGMPQQGFPPAAAKRAAEGNQPVVVWQRDVRIRRGSYYGHRLRAVSTLAAMGPAMQSAREKARQEAAPVRRQFEMTAICRSYFDPLLLAAILRWCRPDETWWGTSTPVGAVLQETVARFAHDDPGRRILLGELLLAAIMGKVAAGGLDSLATMALQEAEDLAEDDDVRSALEWGAAVVQSAIAKAGQG